MDREAFLIGTEVGVDVPDDDPFFSRDVDCNVGPKHAFDERLAAPCDHAPLALVSKNSRLSISLWCQNMVTAVFRCRCSFVFFVRHAISLHRADKRSVSPAFPLPLPYVGVFAKMPSGLSSIRRAKIHFRRAVTIIVLALNFWWNGSRFVSDVSLTRVPSPSQRAIFVRIENLLQVDGPSESFCISGSGRKFPQLIARLAELSGALTNLGPGANPYDKTFDGVEIDPAPLEQDELEPYRSLDSSRLVLHGSGKWDPTPWLSDSLVMAYRNPDTLLFERDPDSYLRPKMTDPVEELAALARLWDKHSLLFVHHHDVGVTCPHELVKIFNCLKSQDADRQIGDRRGRNGVECRVEGVSHNLPTGYDLLDLAIELPDQCLTMSITDRRDFYHQFQVSRSRAVSNTLGPGIPWKLLSDTEAFNQFLLRQSRSKKDRLVSGDHLGGLHGRFPQERWSGSGDLYLSFASILQGDHGGVEYACDSHVSFLQDSGLLDGGSRVVADRPFFGRSLLQGLVIDDFFAVAVGDRKDVSETQDVRCFNAAKSAYKAHNILGSDSKDVVGQRCAKIVGAQINSTEEALEKGLCTIGSPPQKRYGLSWITLMVCQLAFTTDVLHVCLLGAWVSVLMFRRPLMAVLNKSFKLVNASQVDASHPRLVRLPRTVIDELAVLALLVPFAVSDLSAMFCSEVFATDASLSKGAICSTKLPYDVCRTLWSGLRSKGAYHRLLSPVEALSRRLGLGEEVPDLEETVCKRPLAFHYDFIEIFSGAAVVTTAMSSMGLVVGPPIDLSLSPEFNMEWVHVIAWLTFLISSKRVKSFLVSPPCTTFSIMRRPALRSKLVPHGFNPDCSLTRIGNLLAHRGFQLLRVGWINGVPGIFETPFTALLKHLPGYRSFLGKPGVEMCRSDSCMFGSIHQKSFRLLGVHVSLKDLSVTCDHSHQHVLVQGAWTKASATYVPRLAETMAKALSEAILVMKSKVESLHKLNVRGHESQLVNSIALSSSWSTEKAWTFARLSHINILEMNVLAKLADRLVAKGVPLRVSALVDSFVCSAAASKGRSSSVGLSRPLRRFCATSVAAFLFFAVPFVPTRLNPSDDPTRDVPVRSPSGSFTLVDWSLEHVQRLCLLPRLRRWASN